MTKVSLFQHKEFYEYCERIERNLNIVIGYSIVQEIEFYK